MIASGQVGSRLVRLDPSTFAVIRKSARVGSYEGWVRSPDGKQLAVATSGNDDCSPSALRFASVADLTWARRAVTLDGCFSYAIWPRPGRLYALVGDCCDSRFRLETVDVRARKVVERRPVRGPLEAAARSADGLVVLAGGANRIAPARLLVLGPDGGIRSVRLEQILAGVHYPTESRDPIGETREPGLAVDPTSGVAYVVDAGGLVAVVRLRDLSVRYQRLGSGSLLDRLAAWLTPPAQAKGMNGPMLSAQWLGDGLLAVAGTDYAAHSLKNDVEAFTTVPTGLRIVDTHGWSVRTLDPEADSASVAGGLLLTTGSRRRSRPSGGTSSGEGLAAYGPERSLRWRLDAGSDVSLIAAYGRRALIQSGGVDPSSPRPFRVVDLGTGRVLRRLAGWSYIWPLLGSGS